MLWNKNTGNDKEEESMYSMYLSSAPSKDKPNQVGNYAPVRLDDIAKRRSVTRLYLIITSD